MKSFLSKVNCELGEHTMQEEVIGVRRRCTLLGAALLGASVLLVACHPRVDRAKADQLAAAGVQQYAKNERLNAERFTKPEVREQQGKWLYIYEYLEPPKQSVAVIVFVDGHVEVSRMLEDHR